METNELDELAEHVVAVLAEREGESYASEKAQRLAGLSRFQVLSWCNNLDAGNLRALAERLGIDPTRFAVAVDVTRSL